MSFKLGPVGTCLLMSGGCAAYGVYLHKEQPKVLDDISTLHDTGEISKHAKHVLDNSFQPSVVVSSGDHLTAWKDQNNIWHKTDAPLSKHAWNQDSASAYLKADIQSLHESFWSSIFYACLFAVVAAGVFFYDRAYSEGRKHDAQSAR